MNKKDAAVIKVLSQLNLRKEPQLTPEQQKQLQDAKDPQAQFLDQVQKTFSDNTK